MTCISSYHHPEILVHSISSALQPFCYSIRSRHVSSVKMSLLSPSSVIMNDYILACSSFLCTSMKLVLIRNANKLSKLLRFGCHIKRVNKLKRPQCLVFHCTGHPLSCCSINLYVCNSIGNKCLKNNDKCNMISIIKNLYFMSGKKSKIESGNFDFLLT